VTTRRSVLGASLALSALAGCDGPDEFGHPLHGRARGAPSEDASWATTLELDGLGRGVLVRTRAGHPIKVEGNPRHPASLGASDVFLESAPLSLHAPERSRHALHRGRRTDPEAAFAAMRGDALRLLTGPVSSPTLLRLIGEWLAATPGAAWHVLDPLADGAALEGALRAFGEAVAVVPDLASTRALLCLGADPLGPGPAQLALARGWRDARPHLMVAEVVPSLTGARADLRLAPHPAEADRLARAVAAALGVPGLRAPAAHPQASRIADRLRDAGPAALVLAGPGQPASVHALALAMNAHLGSLAQRLIAPPLGAARPLAELAAALEAGAVERLVILDANPAYAAPGLSALLERAGRVLHLGARRDETARLAEWHVPLAHPLESWGDSRAFDGTPSLRQPVTQAGAASRCAIAAVMALIGEATPVRDAVRQTWREAWGDAGFEERWTTALEEGIAGPPSPAVTPPLHPDWDHVPPARPVTLAASFAPDPHLRAGEFAHEAWLQELPRPITRLAWGNAALLAPATAVALGLVAGDEVELSFAGRGLRAPVLPIEGHAEDCVTLPLGGGRRAGGPVGEGRGFDANALRPDAAAWVAYGLVLRRTGRRQALPVMEPHRALEGAPPLRVLAPGQAFPPPRSLASMHAPWPYPAAAWGMAIDLDACIGCNACASACQAENNVPVVGPEAMQRGRGLHWLRVDRHPRPMGRAAFQPVPCMHCEQAPCEPVCPVNATVHDHEGLNAMVHARCIGTRTCSNNCPYKVRRFNWEDHRAALDTPARNPDVPLRPRGVMEKCTYCSHRIAAARSEGRLDALETACQRACPTRAITFGDLKDAHSPVAQARRDGRAYLLLEELGTRPRSFYLARIEDEA
jgi:Fe-S-cluster-containing dehydrogenase component